MDCMDLLGTSFSCDCGKQHRVPTKHMYYGENAYDYLFETARTVSNGPTYLVIADARTYEAAGRLVVEKLQSDTIEVKVYIVQDRDGDSPAADNRTKDVILKNAPKADLYIAVGSGVINDLVKWVSYLEKKPYLTVPTAASMNGYASANVAASIDGLKVLFHADACYAAFVRPDIIFNAPYELTVSGLGDVLAKSVSSADWKLNQFLFDDYFCQFSVDLLKDLEPVYLENPIGIKKKEPQAFKALFEALFFSSVAMTITGTSSPASGGEHLISHTLDMVADRDERRHDYHGRQVGVASILMAAIYEKIMAIETPEFKAIPTSINTDFWGSLSPVVEKEYLNKIPKMELAINFLSNQKNWDGLRALIRPNLVPASKLKTCLTEAGAAHTFQDIRDNGTPLAIENFLATVIHANQMRERFTILDIAVLLGIIPGDIEQLVTDWVSK